MRSEGDRQIVKASDPVELLALVPYLAGMQPTRSIVFVAFAGTRADRALRIDLPTWLGDPAVLDGDALNSWASTVVEVVGRIGSLTDVAVVVYDDVLPPDGTAPHARSVHAVLNRLDEADIGVREALYTTPHGWGGYLWHPGPLPVEHLARGEAALVAALGAPPAHDQFGPRSVEPPRELAERVAQRVRELELPFREHLDGGSLAEFAMPFCLLDVASAALDDEVGVEAAALLLTVVARPAIRDWVLAEWVYDEQRATKSVRDAAAFLNGDEVEPPDYGGFLSGSAPAPDRARLTRAVALAERLVPLAPRSTRAPILTMLGWLQWASGRSSRAARCIDSALEIDPGYGLADLMRHLLDRGVLPTWVLDAGAVSGAA